jgi:histidinol dehydrogenase
MQTVQEIVSAVSQLSKDALASFREWFDEFDAETWDKQLEDDVMSGKLDNFADQAISDFQAGKCKEL